MAQSMIMTIVGGGLYLNSSISSTIVLAGDK